MINGISIQIKPQEFKKAVFRLSPKQRIKLLEELEEELFPARFKEIISILRAKAKKPLSFNKITEVCKRVRKNLYEKEIKGSN